MSPQVSGKHGNLKRDFKHLPIELFLSEGGKKVEANEANTNWGGDDSTPKRCPKKVTS